ncbi:methylesterase 3-like [Selaginella moellendorffii]|uniref:methylesterase 3-like n=1 Tax=Selaginella moellendorffii TaxID=88036 RepID=UPI000D1CAAA8|nr:methylesterase 3-like [Selaginella moellendorffii]|eukprot:XP_024540724.1 methylesterase 3-like [Selaginella moellendorffii]
MSDHSLIVLITWIVLYYISSCDVLVAHGVKLEQKVPKKLHFVLVHGAGHGAWCWYKVTHKLEQEGHSVDAVDLTSAGTNGVDAKTVGSLEAYSVSLIELLESLPANDKVILVGHSLGGISLTYAMERFPQKISGAVYVTAIMLPSNGSQALSIYNKIAQGLGDKFTLSFRNGSVTAGSFKPEHAREMLYQRSPPQDFVLAKSILKPFPYFDPTVSFTVANYGKVPRYYIKAKKDKTIPLEIQEEMIKQTPPLKVLELNSDHSPFFSMPNASNGHIVKKRWRWRSKEDDRICEVLEVHFSPFGESGDM